RAFSSHRRLTKHQRLRTGEKGYRCPDCSRGFNHRSDLLLLQRSHLEQKPCICLDGPKSFTCSSQL
ncbi:ZFP1 protein, partial [Sagittarius serpentarius]|nr:ZFP1 protein [Sagittarius serpentarius]